MLKMTFTYDGDKYMENPQKNPIRWRFMYKEEDGSFSDQGNWMACKDFFNDVVAKFTGKVEFAVYRFNNSKLKKNDEGFYVLVKNIQDKESFYHNIDKAINPMLVDQLSTNMVAIDGEDGQAMLLFPNVVLTSTYYISLLTLVIRCSNYGKKANNWNELIDIVEDKESNGKNHYSNQNSDTLEVIRGEGFGYELAREYWWYYNDNYNSSKRAGTSAGVTTIHNCGIQSWICGLQ